MRLHYGNPFAPIQSLYAGVLQAKPGSTRAAGSFCKITSGRALNRSPESRGSQTSGVLFGSFCTTQKERKNVPFAGNIEVLQTSNQRTKITTSCNPIKSFCRPVSLKHGRLAYVRSQFSLFRRSPTHKNLPPATFCTSERHSPCCYRNNSCRFAALCAAMAMPAHTKNANITRG